MSDKISMDKQYQTRNGRRAKILAVDVKDADYTVAAIVERFDGTEGVETFTNEGRHIRSEKGGMDLIEIKSKRVMWVNVYNDDLFVYHRDRAHCDKNAEDGRIARLRIEFTEGQFDEEPS